MARRAVAVITDIHGNLPALEAALSRIEELGSSGSTAAATWSATGRMAEPGLRADPGARDPDHPRQLRLRDRARPRGLRLRVHHPA